MILAAFFFDKISHILNHSKFKLNVDEWANKMWGKFTFVGLFYDQNMKRFCYPV